MLNPTKKTRREAGKALDDGKNVKAKVTVLATDAAGNVATEKSTIRLAVAPPGEAALALSHRQVGTTRAPRRLV